MRQDDQLVLFLLQHDGDFHDGDDDAAAEDERNDLMNEFYLPSKVSLSMWTLWNVNMPS